MGKSELSSWSLFPWDHSIWLGLYFSMSQDRVNFQKSRIFFYEVKLISSFRFLMCVVFSGVGTVKDFN